MKVLLASDFYPPQTGGMEQHVQALARELRRQGHAVVVATTAGSAGREIRDGVPVARLRGTAQRLTFAFSDPGRRYPPPLVDPELTWALGRLIARTRPDVVHAHGWISYTALAAATRAGRPAVVTLHDYGHFCPKRTLIRDGAPCLAGRGWQCLPCARAEYGTAKALLTFAGTGAGLRRLRTAGALVAVSRYVAEQSAPYLPGRAISVLPNFLDPAAFAAECDQAARTALPAHFVLFAGVLAPFKGVDDLLTAWQILRNRGAAPAGTTLLLLGRAHASRAYAADPASGVLVLHDPPRGLVAEAIAACDCLVVPSRWPESAGRVVLEGVCAGRPIVASTAGGIPEMLAGVPGARLVPPADPAALAAAIGAALTDAPEAPAPWGGPPDYLPLHPARVTRALLDVYAGSTRRHGEHGVRIHE